MSNPARSNLRYDVDRLVISGHRLFGWGWLAHRSRPVRELHLEVEGDGWRKRLSVTQGFPRDDVARAFPDFADAATSGFVVTGYLPALSATKLALHVSFEDGGEDTVELEGVALSAPQRPVQPFTARRLLRAFVRRLKSRDFSGLLQRHRDRNLPLLDEGDIAAALVEPLKDAHGIRMIFDHDMGGGANQYRRKLIAAWLAAGDAVVLCTFHLPTLDYRIHLMLPGGVKEFRTSSFVALESVIARTQVVELVVNSPVSFDDPKLLADWLARMRTTYPRARLTVAMHDYFSVCPSYVLLNAEGKFCGIPDLGECARCLRHHEGANVALSPPTEIGPWREAWGRCLRAADEVRCFSMSTQRLLVRAYPALERMTLVPHERDFIPSRQPRADHGAPLVVGVLGTISEQKGSAVVTEIVERLAAADREARVVILGTLNAASDSRQLTVAGPYKRGDLPDLIERHGINMFLFPSIWPETFSYVVAEMMALGLPIVAFDLGAPAERLRDYRLARLVGTVSAESASSTLLDFHRELAAQSAHAS